MYFLEEDYNKIMEVVNYYIDEERDKYENREKLGLGIKILLPSGKLYWLALKIVKGDNVGYLLFSRIDDGGFVIDDEGNDVLDDEGKAIWVGD